MSTGIKRFVDIAVAFVALLAFSPVIIVVALLVVLTMGTPVFFRQQRPGLDGRPFSVLKFRTMNTATDESGNLLPVDKRITPLGRILRRFSIDELPQLWNVLKGEMSLVGPRPLLMEYLDRYSPEQMRRHEVRPGITGLAQISGRQHLPFSRRIELDVYYVDNWSLLMDFRIMLGTLYRLFGLTEVDPIGKYELIDDLARKPNQKDMP